MRSLYVKCRTAIQSALRSSQRRRLRSKPFSTVAAQVELLESRELLTVGFYGGPLLPHVEAQAVYLGSDWNGSALQSEKTQLDQFVSTVVNSPYMDMLTNAGYNVGRGTATAGAVGNFALDKINGITDAQIRSDIQSMLTAGQLQAPDANRLYNVYVEPGVLIKMGSNTSATSFLGYHSAFGGTTAQGAAATIRYAVISYPGAPNVGSASQGFSSDFNELTSVTSHELAESVTDPNVGYNGFGWYDARFNGEIADLANHTNSVMDGYLVANVVDQNDNVITPPASASPTAPKLTASAPSPTAANLSWSAVSQAMGYRVFQVNGAQSTLLATLSPGTTTFQVSGLTPASTASFMVAGYNGSGTANSTTVSVTQPLAAPQLTISALSPTSAQLSWGGVTGALAYRIYQVNGTQSVLLTALPGLSRTYTVNGLWPSATYSFRVEAYSGPTIADSAVVSVTQPLAVPQLTVKAASPTSAQLSWGGVQGALAYRIYRVNGTQSVLLTALPGLSRTFAENGLWPSATYSFKVEAYSGPTIADSTVVSVTQPLAAPQLTASPLSRTSAQLSWGGVQGALAYRIYRISGTQKVLLIALPGLSRSFTATGLAPSSTSSFMVEAYSGPTIADSAAIVVTQPA